MNQMTTALTTAGFPAPSYRKRVWQYIKDHPHCGTVALSDGTGIKRSVLTQVLIPLRSEGLIEDRTTYARVNGRTVRQSAYYCSPKFPEYVDGPSWPSSGAKKSKAKATPTSVVEIVPAPTPKQGYELTDEARARLDAVLAHKQEELKREFGFTVSPSQALLYLLRTYDAKATTA